MSRRILVVVGTDAERERAQQTLESAGYETDSVGNGQDGFDQLMAMSYDLVVADCSLEKLSFPAMFDKVRGLGVKTPFLLWCAVTDKAALFAALKAAGGTYVDRAAPMGELVKQVESLVDGGGQVAPPVAPEPSPKPAGPDGGVLLIDARDEDVEGLRGLLPPSVGLQGCAAVKDGFALAHSHRFDVVLFSADNSITDLTGIIAQLHRLLPDGFVVGVASPLRDQSPQAALKALDGLDFDELMLKPFGSDSVRRLVELYCSSWDEWVVVSDDVVRVSARCRRREQHDKFVSDLKARLERSVSALVDGCFDRAVIDMSRVEALSPMDLGEVARHFSADAKAAGLKLVFVVGQGMLTALRKLETSLGWESLGLALTTEEARK